jgi:hypothetical protein
MFPFLLFRCCFLPDQTRPQVADTLSTCAPHQSASRPRSPVPLRGFVSLRPVRLSGQGMEAETPMEPQRLEVTQLNEQGEDEVLTCVTFL